MSKTKTIAALLAVILLSIGQVAVAQDGGTGAIKGKVKVQGQGPTAGIAISVRQNEREVAHAVSDSKGEFFIKGLAPGIYGLSFRKAGLSLATLDNIEVKAGKTKSLSDRLILTTNEAADARLWSSVFNEGGFSMRGVRLELARLGADGMPKKVDGRLTNESGQAVFRLSPDKATYRVTVKIEGQADQTKDVEIDGAMDYRVAFTVQRPPK
jgi:hypothetical protein